MTLPFLIPLIETDRLVLRAPREDDAAALGEFYAGERSAWIGGPWPRSDAIGAIWADIGHWAVRGRGLWMVALRGTDQPIGRCGLISHAGWSEPELGWHLFDGWEGKGYAYEASLAARRHSHDVLGYPPLMSFVEPANLRSARLALRLGATVERTADLDGMTVQVFRHPSGGTAA